MKKNRLSLSTRALLLAAGASFTMPALAETEAAVAATVDMAEQPAVPAATTSDKESDQFDRNEIIVTAPRLAGQLDTDIAAEAELDETAIASYG